MDPGAGWQPFAGVTGEVVVGVTYVAALGVTGAAAALIPARSPPSFRRKPESILLGFKGLDPGFRRGDGLGGRRGDECGRCRGDECGRRPYSGTVSPVIPAKAGIHLFQRPAT